MTTNEYGPRGELLTTSYADGTQVAREYDRLGRLVGIASPVAQETYQLDPVGRLLKAESTVFGSAPVVKSLSFTYDEAGNRTSLTDTDGRTVLYDYDRANRLVGLTDPDGRRTSYAFNDAGQLASIQYPNGGGVEYAYDDASRLAGVTNLGGAGVASAFTYTRDGNGNVTGITEEDGAASSFTYDELDRLVQATYPKAKIEDIRSRYYVASESTRPTEEGLEEAPADGTGADATEGATDSTAPGQGKGGSKKLSAVVDLAYALAVGASEFALRVWADVARLFAPAAKDSDKTPPGQSKEGSKDGSTPSRSAGGNSGNGNAGGNSGGSNGKSDLPHGQGAKSGVQDLAAEDPGYRTYLEAPDYFLTPYAEATYTYVYIGSKG